MTIQEMWNHHIGIYLGHYVTQFKFLNSNPLFWPRVLSAEIGLAVLGFQGLGSNWRLGESALRFLGPSDDATPASGLKVQLDGS